MSNKFYHTLLLTLLPLVSVFGQAATASEGQLIGDIENEAQPGASLAQIPMLTPATKGNSYLDDSWMLASVEFYGGKTYENHLVRYDLAHRAMEIKIDKTIKAVDDKFIKTLKSLDIESGDYKYYSNAREIPVNQHNLEGLIRVMNYNGYWDLMIVSQLEYVDASYNTILDAGINTNKINKKEIYYLQSQNSLELLQRRRKLFLNQFGLEYTESIKKFVKAHQLNTTKLNDISMIIVFANAIRKD